MRQHESSRARQAMQPETPDLGESKTRHCMHGKLNSAFGQLAALGKGQVCERQQVLTSCRVNQACNFCTFSLSCVQRLQNPQQSACCLSGAAAGDIPQTDNVTQQAAHLHSPGQQRLSVCEHVLMGHILPHEAAGVGHESLTATITIECF